MDNKLRLHKTYDCLIEQNLHFYGMQTICTDYAEIQSDSAEPDPIQD